MRRGAAFEQRDVEDREEVLVPAHGDAVLADAAEAEEDALVELVVELSKSRIGRGALRRRRELDGAAARS
jgi:hypothetical protein